MPGFLSHVRHSASQMAFNSLLYHWSLRGAVPERMVVRPVDPWAGCAKAGRILCDGGLPEGYAGDALHGFVWLRDLRAFAQEKGCARLARQQARVMIESWIERHGRWEAASWSPDILGERVALWISNYEFFAQYLDDMAGEGGEDYADFQELFFESLSRQACHLSRLVSRAFEVKSSGLYGIEALKAARGLLYAGLAFEGREAWVEQALSFLGREIKAQLFEDGTHRSRSPAALLEALQIMLDVRLALGAGGYPLPDAYQHAIERMGQALLVFRYQDKGLAVFNGGREGCTARVDAVLAQAGLRSKRLKSLPQAGFEVLNLGRTSLMFDCGVMPSYPFDRSAHAAPLSFEMSYGRERLFVNCGSHSSDAQWRDLLRGGGAHSALTLDYRNAYEIAENGHFVRRVQARACRREEGQGVVSLEGSHDGYEALNGFIHHRHLFLSDGGHKICGEDVLCTGMPPAKPIEAIVRFHLHPRVMVSLIREGQEALLRLPGGTGWRFHSSGGVLALEDSVYLGHGDVQRKTKQLVIYGQVIDVKNKISWGLEKEG